MDFEYNGNLLEDDRINLVANEIVNKYALINNEKLVGQVVPVLIEGESQKGNGLYAGYTDTMKLTNVKCDNGKIINVKITESKTWSLNGEKE